MFVFLFFMFVFSSQANEVQKKKIKINLKDFHTLDICKPDYVEKLNNNVKSTTKTEEVETKSPSKDDEKIYRANLYNKLKKNGISSSTANNIVDNAKYIEKSVQKRNEQPEFIKTFDYYRDQIYKINDKKTIDDIVDFYKKNKETIDDIEKIFNVDKEILLTISYMETKLGRITGSTRLIDAFFTMGIKNIRRNFFEASMISFAKLVDFEILNIDARGSWDGGYGYTQFMPESIMRYGISYNNDGKLDLMTVSDSFASTAHYLFENGWHYDNTAIIPLKTKVEIQKCLVGFNKTNNIKNWQEIDSFKNSIEIDEQNLPENEHFTIIMPDLRNDSVEKKEVFIGFDNFKVILTYNKSIYYATNASLLYNKLKKELN